MDEHIYTTKEVAAFMKISKKTVGNPVWRRSVGLAAIRPGRELRFRESDVQKCLEGRREVLELR
jgi:excisionase family DNA binding protein